MIHSFEKYLIEQFGETWERSGVMEQFNAAIAPERDQIVLSALDMMGVQLANHHHQWSNDQRGLYEHAVELLKGGSIRNQPINT